MYLSHYNLKSKPFQITTDPKYIWFGEKHSEALATLRYGIQEDKGFLVLTGEIGTGKTSVINCLIKELDLNIIKATIPDPDISIIEFFNFISKEFNMGMKFDGKGEFFIHLKQFLLNAYSDEKKVLLIIDEAQRLNFELLEQIRLLSNIEVDDAKLINIFFVGQKEFNDILMDEKSKAVRQRIAVRCNIDPLTVTETKELIEHRLKVAGSKREIFDPSAMNEIFLFSRGYPRLINILCDHAMLTVYAAGKSFIDKKVIIECAKELSIPSGKSYNGGEKKLMMGKKKSWRIVDLPNPSSWAKPLVFLSIAALLLSVALTFFEFKSEPINTSSHDTNDLATMYKIENSNLPQITSESIRETETDKHRISKLDENHRNDSKKDHTKSKIGDESSIISKENLQNYNSMSDNIIVIQFDLNSSKMPNKALEILDQLAEFMINRTEKKIKITGYTDSTGDYDYNLSVSKLRADKIKSYLCNRGVNCLNIETLGLGPDNPIASNATLDGRRKNRRVEIEFKDQPQKNIARKSKEATENFIRNDML